MWSFEGFSIIWLELGKTTTKVNKWDYTKLNILLYEINIHAKIKENICFYSTHQIQSEYSAHIKHSKSASTK